MAEVLAQVALFTKVGQRVTPLFPVKLIATETPDGLNVRIVRKRELILKGIGATHMRVLAIDTGKVVWKSPEKNVDATDSLTVTIEADDG